LLVETQPTLDQQADESVEGNRGVRGEGDLYACCIATISRHFNYYFGFQRTTTEAGEVRERKKSEEKEREREGKVD
jgi:hypothetical protein